MALTVRQNQDWSEINVTLNNQEATTDVAGSIKIATSTEVNSAEATDKAVTPATLGKGQANGVAALNADARVDLANLPIVVSTRRATSGDSAAIWFSI